MKKLFFIGLICLFQITAASAQTQPFENFNPTLLVEVLSESTEKYDRGRKFQHYRSIESLREHVLVSQDEARIENM